MPHEQLPAQPSDGKETLPNPSRRLEDESYVEDAVKIYCRYLLDDAERAFFEEDLPALIEDFNRRYIGSYSHPDAFIEESLKRLGWEQTLRIAASKGRFPIGMIALDHEVIYDYLSRYYRIIADASHEVAEGMPVIHVYGKPGVTPPRADYFDTENGND